MQGYVDYAGQHGPDRGNRAYREALMFQMINHFDRKALPDGEAYPTEEERQAALTEKGFLTLEQKRRLRNEIFRVGSAIIKKHNRDVEAGKVAGEPYTEYDPQPYVEAFFQTNFGKQYATQGKGWVAGTDPVYQGYTNDIRAWTKSGRSRTGTECTVISPYDPRYSLSDLFTDDTDELGYVIDNPDRLDPSNAAHFVDGFAATRSGDGLSGALGLERDSRGNVRPVIRAVQLGRNHGIQPMSEGSVIQRSEPMRELEGTLTQSGYRDISHFIRTKDDKEAVRKFLLAEMNRTNPKTGAKFGPVPERERKFMGDVCRDLSAAGLDFGVKIGGDGQLVAAVENPKAEIRILSRGDEQYQGRIYSRGIVTRLGSPNQDMNVAEVITPEDRRAMIKWYFGLGSVKVIDNDRGSSRHNHNVGDTRSTISIGNTKYNAVSLSDGRGNDSSIVFAVKAYRGKTGSNRLGLVNIMRSPSSVSNEADLPETSFSKSMNLNDTMFGDETIANPLVNNDERIPVEKLLPQDRAEVPNPDGTMGYVRHIRHDTDIEYYQHLVVREHLNQWVEAAKANHARMVDIEGMVRFYNEEYQVDPDAVFDFSEDENVAEVQAAYLDILTGKTDIGEPEDGVDMMDYKLEEIRIRYEEYLEDAFGTVPEIRRPGLPDYPKSGGFNPKNVSRYVDTIDSYDVQKNQSFIRHMLSRLGDDYDESFIRGDDYVANSMRNSLVKFNPNAVRAEFTLREILDNGTDVLDMEKLNAIEGLKDMPFTKEMLVHTARTLQESGCSPLSVAVRVDEHGIIEYSGYVPTVKTQTSRDYSATVTEYRNLQARQGVPSNEQMLFATFDESKCIPSKLPAGHPLAADVSRLHRVHGFIGQVFEPDRNGAIIQDTVVQDDRVLIPGYDAYLVENDPEDPTPMAERLRLVGLEQQMRRAITSSIRDSVFTMDQEYNFEPHTTDLNSVYRRTYDTVLDVKYYDRMLDPEKTSEEERAFFGRVLKTMAGRCRFPNVYGENSTTMAQSYLEHPHEKAAKDFDYYYSDLCDNQNLRVLGRYFDNIFDRDMTATAKNQGIVRYLVQHVTVNPDGSVTPVDRLVYKGEPHCEMIADPAFRTMYFNSWDRRQMATTQSLTALGTPRQVGVAMLNIEGYNFDDAMPVSKAFAEAHKIIGADGEERALMPQDKLSDFSGNKGVISAVVDPSLASWNIIKNMTIEDGSEGTGSADYKFNNVTYHVRYDDRRAPKGETREQAEERHKKEAAAAIQKKLGVYGQDPLMKFFEDNPHVDIAMAPYSGMSRTNGGIARELLANPVDAEGKPLKKELVVNGKTIQGGMGYTNIIIVDMPADVKTHWYDEKAIKEGKGRKASGQLAWALQSKGASAIMREFYGNNQSALDDMREYAISIGLDFNEKMEPVIGYHPQEARGERRMLMKLPDLSEGTDNPRYFQKMSAKADKDDKAFYGWLNYGRLNSKGDDSAKRKIRLLPAFETDAKARMMEMLNAHGGFMELPFQLDFKTPEYTKLSSSLLPDGLFGLQRTGQTYDSPTGPKDTYGMPVLPIGLRSNQEFQDGQDVQHAFTTGYSKIYKSALTYLACERQMAMTTDEAQLQLLEAGMTAAKADAQKEFDKITSKIADTKFNTKYNLVREGIMSSRIPNSATAVWSPDPRLDLDEVAMSTEHAKQLGLVEEDGTLKKDARVLLWRDPILHDDNVRYMKVTINENVHGVAINPLVDKSFDGDFDGDSVGIVPLQNVEAQKEAYSKFALEFNLLQKGVVDEKGNHPLYIQTGLDVATNMHKNKDLKTRLDALTEKINELERNAAIYMANPTEENARLVTVDIDVAQRDENGKVIRGAKKVRKTIDGLPAINNLRRQYKDELNQWAHEALAGTGGAHIVVENEQTLVASVQEIVDSKAKGNASKMRDYMDNVGIDYSVDEEGRAIAGSAKNITNAKGEPISRDGSMGRQREKDMAIQETAAYKADNTALGGTTAQNGVSAFRDYDLTAALELTYPITQAILQSKHDPKDAKIKDEIVRFWGKDIWDGYKLTGDFTSSDPEAIQQSAHRRVRQYVLDDQGHRIPRKEKVVGPDGKATYEDMKDRDGNIVYETAYQKCTRNEWVEQMTGMMRALKVDINPEYINRLADIMVRREAAPLVSADTGYTITTYDKDAKVSSAVKGGRGTVAGLTDFASENGSLLDRVAYTGRLTALVSEAMKKEPGYAETISRMGRDHELQAGSFSSIMADTVANAIAIKAQEARIVEAKAAKDKAAESAAKAEIRRLRVEATPSAMFAPRQFSNEVAGDAKREETGEDKNVFTKKKGKEEVTVSVVPKPVGSRNCRISVAEYEIGTPFMGESQADYDARRGITVAQEEPAAGMQQGGQEVQAASPFTAAFDATLARGAKPVSQNPFSEAFDRTTVDEVLGVDTSREKEKVPVPVGLRC